MRVCAGSTALREEKTPPRVLQKPESTLCSVQASLTVFIPRESENQRKDLGRLAGTFVGGDGISDRVWGPLEPPAGTGQPVSAVVLEEAC